MTEIIILFVAIIATMWMMFFASEKLLSKNTPKLDRIVGIVQSVTGLALVLSFFCSWFWFAQISFALAVAIMVVFPFIVVFKYSNIWWRVSMIVSLGMYVSLCYITGDFYIFMAVALSACAILIARAIAVFCHKEQN